MGVVRKLTVTIEKSGKVNLDVQNAVGSECLGWTKGLEQALVTSEDSVKREKKASFFQESESSTFAENESD